MPNPIVHFEIPAEDVKRAKKFYEMAFGWKISDPWNMDYFFVETKEGGEGINGGLMKRSMEGQPFMNYIAVESIDAIAKKVVKAGGQIVMPKQAIAGGMGWIGAFVDTEGNLMGFHQTAPPPAQKAAKKAAKTAVKKAAKRAVKKAAKKR